MLGIHGIENLGQLVAMELLLEGLAHEGTERLGSAGPNLLLCLRDGLRRYRQRYLRRGHTFILPKGASRSSRPRLACRWGQKAFPPRARKELRGANGTRRVAVL